MNEIGYHGTALKWKDQIEENGLDPAKVEYRDDHWLGQGVYFFDDYEKAMWWANCASKKYGYCGAVIFQSEIFADDNEVLDLNITSHMDKFLASSIDLLKGISDTCNGQMPIFTQDKLRAVYFDYYKEQHKISVIIATFPKMRAGYTAKRTKEDWELQKQIIRDIGIRYSERQICVSNKDCIKNTKLVYNDSEEVI